MKKVPRFICPPLKEDVPIFDSILEARISVEQADQTYSPEIRH